MCFWCLLTESTIVSKKVRRYFFISSLLKVILILRICSQTHKLAQSHTAQQSLRKVFAFLRSLALTEPFLFHKLSVKIVDLNFKTMTSQSRAVLSVEVKIDFKFSSLTQKGHSLYWYGITKNWTWSFLDPISHPTQPPNRHFPRKKNDSSDHQFWTTNPKFRPAW